MIRRLLCFAGIHARVLRHDFDGTFTTVCRGCEPLRYKLLTELMEQRPPFGIDMHVHCQDVDVAAVLAAARTATAAHKAAQR